MDMTHKAQKSASHGSLNSTYRSHNRSANTLHSRQPSQRRPLHSVNENATLLRGPGPLESMLKTTTKTGDIGVFSIKSAAIPATYHQPPRPRPILSDTGILQQSRSRLRDEGYLDNDYKWAKSHRDTTSEIISLYASENHHSYQRPSSPYDDGQRSYSMATSCSSRHIASQKSSGTLQSQSSSTGLQRPRSPFPYPTRLKRPGVRPASPAVGENGVIDYSRMVELHRVSQRTVHGSYKSAYSHESRKPPPLSLRTDFNRTSSTLPSRTSPGRHNYGQGRSRTPSSSNPWSSRQHDRYQVGSTDQSIRSASLTSIVEMYQRPVAEAGNFPPMRSVGSFYYDYSEGFDKQPSKGIEPRAPICPIPQRGGSIRTPMVLRDESQDSFDVPPPQERDTTPCQNQYPSGLTKEIDGLMSTVDPAKVPNLINAEEESPSSPTSTTRTEEFTPSVISVTRSATTPPKIHAISEQWVASNGAWRLSKTIGAEPNASESLQIRRASQASLSKLKCSMEPTLSEFASLFDQLAKSPFSRGGDETMQTEDELFGDSRCDEESVCSDGRTRLPRRASLQLLGVGKDGKVYWRRHRRNLAAMQIDDAGFNSEEPKHNDEGLKILSPEPISPTCQLRVKNSIPQLMKALPPLPQDVENYHEPKIVESVPFPEVKALEPKVISGQFDNKDQTGCPIPSSNVAEVTETPEPECHGDNITRLKLCAQTLPSSGLELEEQTFPFCNDKSDQLPLLEKCPTTETKPRLKLKMSRSQLGQGRVGQNAAALRSSRLKQCNSLADLAQCPKPDRLAKQCSVDEAFIEEDSTLNPPTGTADKKEDIETLSDPSPQPSDPFNIPYPPSLDKSERPLRCSVSTNKLAPSELRSFQSDPGAARHQRLRQKFSILRLRRTETYVTGSPKSLATAPPLETRHADASHYAIGEEAETKSDGAQEEKIRAISLRSDRVSGRVKRWASDAKRAVRSYVRRTLDRSSRLSD